MRQWHEPEISVNVIRQSVVDNPVYGNLISEILVVFRGLVENYKRHEALYILSGKYQGITP